MKKAIRVVSFTVFAGIAIGSKFVAQSSSAKETKAQMLEICSTDVTCVEVVDTHFKQCFDANYSMGSRRRSGSLNTQGMADCINAQGGDEYFIVE